MNYILIVVFSFSIFIAAVIGWIRFKQINPTYYPFVIWIWIGSLNEIASFVLNYSGETTAVNNNIYVLVESFLLLWLFINWNAASRKNLILLMILFTILWIVEYFVFFSIRVFSSYFRIIYSFVTVCLSIRICNRLVEINKSTLIRSPVFLICSGLILFYTYKVLVEAFWLYGLNATREFRSNVYLLLVYINLIANLIYAAALLWMPKKQPSSRRC